MEYISQHIGIQDFLQQILPFKCLCQALLPLFLSPNSPCWCIFSGSCYVLRLETCLAPFGSPTWNGSRDPLCAEVRVPPRLTALPLLATPKPHRASAQDLRRHPKRSCHTQDHSLQSSLTNFSFFNTQGLETYFAGLFKDAVIMMPNSAFSVNLDWTQIIQSWWNSFRETVKKWTGIYSIIHMHRHTTPWHFLLSTKLPIWEWLWAAPFGSQNKSDSENQPMERIGVGFLCLLIKGCQCSTCARETNLWVLCQFLGT